MTPDTFSPAALAGYTAATLRYVFIGLVVAVVVAVVLAAAWGIRFWRTGA